MFLITQLKNVKEKFSSHPRRNIFIVLGVCIPVFTLLFSFFLPDNRGLHNNPNPLTSPAYQSQEIPSPTLTVVPSEKAVRIVSDEGYQITFTYDTVTGVVALVQKESGSGLPPDPGEPRDEKNVINLRIETLKNGKRSSTQWVSLPDAGTTLTFTVNVPVNITDAIRVVTRQGKILFEGALL